MIKSSVRIIFIYFSGVISACFSSGTKSGLSYKKLTGTSFSLPEKHRYSFRALLAGIKQVYMVPVIRNGASAQLPDNSSFVYDLAPDPENKRFNFLKFYGIKENLIFLPSTELIFFNSVADKLFFLLLSFPVQVQLMITALYKHDKSGLSRILLNILIARNILRKLLKTGIKKLYMFSIYDTNSSFISYNLMQKGIHVSQVASEVPLYKWNKIIVTDELILCSEFQKQEMVNFNSTILKEEYVLFGPELYYEVAALYKNEPAKNNRIGFYSTGGWIRNKLGHIHQGIDIEASEARILKDLDSILKERKNIELIVYPHPREWSYFSNSEKEMRGFYQKFLDNIDFKLSPPGTSANRVFDEVYLGVCYMTTIIFERAHARRKSAVIYFEEKGFPDQSGLENLIIVNNKTEFQHLIEMSY